MLSSQLINVVYVSDIVGIPDVVNDRPANDLVKRLGTGVERNLRE